jgi:outer membrane protein assembly factor BamB
MNPFLRHLARIVLPFTLALAIQAQEAGLVGHWEFAPERTQNSGMRAVSGPGVTFFGTPRVLRDPAPPRVELPGREERILISSTLDKTLLPALEITAEAWVRVDRTSKWGGIIGAIQDNGDFERGWLLGFIEDRFSFAIASETGKRLTYLTASSTFETNRWYHVAGTYDGTEMRVFVNGQPAGSSRDQSGPILYPPSAPFVIGAYQDEDEHYRLAGAINEVRLFRRALAPAELQARFKLRQGLFPDPAPAPRFFRPAYGPFVDWQDRHSAIVTWETDSPQPTRLDLELPDGSIRKLGDGRSTTRHAVVLPQLQPDLEHHYRLVAPPEGQQPVVSRRYQFDTSFYYRPTPAPAPNAAAPVGPADRARQLLDAAGVRKGYAMLFGASTADLAIELVRHSEFDVILVLPEASRIPALRAQLDAAGVQGIRASVHHAESADLPYGDLFANLIVVENALPPFIPADEVHRLLRPVGGAFLVDQADTDPAAWTRWLSGSTLATLPKGNPGANRLSFIRPRLAGAGDWAHQYGGADNSACSQDELVKGDLDIAWWGDPGPRPMPDRGNRNPAPLSVNGRLFVQGDRILFGIDAYNGAILWSFSAPEIRRANVTRDSSNMSAADDTLYVAHGPFLLGIVGQTGERRLRLTVPDTGADGPRDWGYVAAVSDLILGSRVKRESAYLGDEGEWYEEYASDQVSRVTSDLLFAQDPATGKTLWEYRNGAILNSTITVGDDMVFFLESRSPEAINAPNARLDPAILTDQHLVCLDRRTGRRIWDKDHDFRQLEFMTYLVFGNNTVVVTGTDRRKNFHTFAFNAPSQKAPESGGDDLAKAIGGRLLWSESHKEDKGHHSGHLQHPVVIGDTFFSDQRSFNMLTGELLRKDLPERRGCGVMSAAKGAIFFRHHFHGMWDLESDKRQQFLGIRSGCWLSLIPAGGLLLAPETSAGCSCTHAIQTSVGYIPRSLTTRAQKK